MSEASVSSPPAPGAFPRVVFIANCMYSEVVSGGDIHTLHMAEGALKAGFAVHFFAGHAMKRQLDQRRLPVGLTLTDQRMMAPCNFDSFAGNVKMLVDYAKRVWVSLKQLSQIQPDDVVYSNTDFWFDSIPTVLCQASRKLMILGMDCPTWLEILLRQRPDVKPSRLTSIYYWLSQHLSLRLFRRCKTKRLFYVHPDQKPRLLKLGYREDELIYISNGIDVRMADAVPEQTKNYDVVWTGRVHQQKGIEDLLETLVFLAARLNYFRAVIIGSAKKTLAPRVATLGIADQVFFSGFVSEEEKFRLVKSSRVFLMPSHYESWGIVVGEALACGIPVMAYDVACYRPVFGEFVRYVPLLDREAFKLEALKQVLAARAGKSYLTGMDLSEFKRANSWEEAQRKFCEAIDELA